MKNLLTNQENRHLQFIKTLANNEDWMILDELSSILNCSSRILKKDIQYLNEAYDDFTIHTSKKGVRVEFKHNRGLESFSQKVLSHSEAYQLLELIFFSENTTVKEISDKLNISLSTLYRMVDALNGQLIEEYGFHIEKGPLRLAGSEQSVRYFFYTYFYEKYHHIRWPFEDIDEENVDIIVKRLVRTKEIPTDHIHFDVLKVIIMVNYIRYKHQGLVVVDAEEAYIKTLIPDSNDENEFFSFCEKTFDLPFNEEFISQVLAQFVQKGIYYTYDHFLESVNENQHLQQQVNALRKILSNIATMNHIKFSNVESVIYTLFNVAHLEYKTPQSSYILYNRNGQFAEEIYSEFPKFYADLYEGMTQFRKEMNKPLTEEGLHFYIATVFNWWEDLVPELRRKIDKIRVLVISDRHNTHAKMLKDFISFEFSEQLLIDISDNSQLNLSTFKPHQYELIVSSFKAIKLDDMRHVYISSVPNSEDYLKIQEKIDRIVLERLKK